MFTEKPLRSAAKMISWRVIATLTTMTLVFLFTGRLVLAASVGLVDVIIKTILYYGHERAWDRVKRGRRREKGIVLWFTGLPSSGKTTLADMAADALRRKGFPVERLDGDRLRELFPKTGFSKEERDRHIKRAGLIASTLERNGIAVVASFISPYRSSRKFVKDLCSNFVEIYVSTPVEECQRRDVKGLYAKARAGEIKNMTGLDDPYERPESPDLEINTLEVTPDEALFTIEKYLARMDKENGKA